MTTGEQTEFLYDDTVYCLINTDKEMSIDAVGLKLDSDECQLVGVFHFWKEAYDVERFLREIVRDFDEAIITYVVNHLTPGLVCRIKCKEAYLTPFPKYIKGHENIRQALIDIKASNPKPLLEYVEGHIRDYGRLKSLRALTSHLKGP